MNVLILLNNNKYSKNGMEYASSKYIFQMKNNTYRQENSMEIIIRIHMQLKASEIYSCNDGQWKGLYDKFEDNNIRNGIYFYTYGDSRIPFYIGKSTAKSYNIRAEYGKNWINAQMAYTGSPGM